MKQYGRQLSLTLGNDDESIEINNLRVSFEIIKTQSSEPNSSVIKIYNLSRETQNRIIPIRKEKKRDQQSKTDQTTQAGSDSDSEQAQKKQFTRMVLSVGYDEPQVIYSGDIKEAKIERSDLDIITVLDCGDGFVDYTQARVAVTLKSGATDQDIIGAAAKSMRYTSIGTLDVLHKLVRPRGYVLYGYSREILDYMAVNSNASWSIQDSVLQFIPNNKVLRGVEGFVLSEKSGMIGFPERTDDGIRVKCLLNPMLKVDGVIRVESIMPEFNGDYKITQLSHKGDFTDNEWVSELIGIGGSFQPIKKSGK